MSTENLVDLTYLKNLSNGSDGFVKKMLLLFLQQTPEAVNNLEIHYGNKDWELLRFTAHKLQASFLFIGVEKLPDIIHTVEEYAATKSHLELVPELIVRIKEMSNRAMKELETELNAQL